MMYKKPYSIHLRATTTPQICRTFPLQSIFRVQGFEILNPEPFITRVQREGASVIREDIGVASKKYPDYGVKVQGLGLRV